jgi:hypothetical protein
MYENIYSNIHICGNKESLKNYRYLVLRYKICNRDTEVRRHDNYKPLYFLLIQTHNFHKDGILILHPLLKHLSRQ